MVVYLVYCDWSAVTDGGLAGLLRLVIRNRWCFIGSVVTDQL